MAEVATRPAPTKDAIFLPIPRALIARMGADKFQAYIERITAEAKFLATAGGGQLQTALDVQPEARGGGIGDIFTAPRRKV